MMEDLQISGKTVEEATQKALTRLNVGLDEIEVTVLKQGRGGILGLGSEDALISVKVLNEDKGNENLETKSAKMLLGTLLSKMGVSAEVEIQSSQAMFDKDIDEKPVVLNVTGNDLESLIGRRGLTLDALQYLVRLMFSRQTKSKMPIMIDIDGYKLRRFEDLKTLARNVADQVKSKRSSVRLEPMPAFERRIIHVTLANDPDVETESIGEGESRKIVISPKYRKERINKQG